MMKFNKKFVGVLLALAMLFSLFAVSAAATGTDSATFESSVTINLSHNSVFSVSGYFEIVANDGVEYEIVDVISKGSLSGAAGRNPETGEMSDKFNVFSANKGNASLDLKLNIKGVPAADAVKVIFRYEYQEVSQGKMITATPVEYSLDVVDYTELNAQLDRYNALVSNSSTYTNASWSKASSAASAASALLNKSYKQSEVDAAATALKNAIDALKPLKVNYSALDAKVTEAKALDPNNYVAVNWYEFRVALNNAQAMLNVKNAQEQKTVDDLLAALDSAMTVLKKVEEIYNAGYAAGEEAGKTAGFEAGKTAGFEAGKTEGYNAGLAAGKQQGFEEGKLSVDTEQYYEDGYAAGYDEGYAAGYAAGLAADKDEQPSNDGTDTEPPKTDDTTPAPVEEKSATVWIVLFIIFLVTTLGLAAYIVVTMVLKKKKETDDTPVVDYNIEDDVDADVEADAASDAADDVDADATAEADNDAE